MYRVVTKSTDHRGRWNRENGPWLLSASDAENWADIFRNLGYLVTVESMQGQISSMDGDNDLAHALSSMA